MTFFAIYSAVGGIAINNESLHNTTAEITVEFEPQEYNKRDEVSLMRQAFHTLQKDLVEKHKVKVDEVFILQFTLVSKT